MWKQKVAFSNFFCALKKNPKCIEKVTDNIVRRTFGNNRSGDSADDVSVTDFSISDLLNLTKDYDKAFPSKQSLVIGGRKTINRIRCHAIALF